MSIFNTGIPGITTRSVAVYRFSVLNVNAGLSRSYAVAVNETRTRTGYGWFSYRRSDVPNPANAAIVRMKTESARTGRAAKSLFGILNS